MYTSHTGNTEKVAMSFKKVFKKKGWDCDTFKVSKDTDSADLPSFDAYDLICIGAPVNDGLPAREIFYGRPHGPGMVKRGIYSPGHAPGAAPVKPKKGVRYRPGFDEGFGPNKSILFVTYSGELRGPGEASAALDCLELRIEDARVKCVGKFACAGSWKDRRKTEGRPWHYDLDNRPNERDLLKAEIFLEEIIEDYYYDGEMEAAPISQYVCIA